MRLQNEEGINIHDIEYFKNYREKHYKGHSKCPTSLAWSPSGSLLVTAQLMIKIWAFSEDFGLQKLTEIKGHQYNIEHAEFSSNNLLGTLSRDSIKFWDVRQNGTMKQQKIEKKGKSQFARFSWNHSDSAGDHCKLSVINKDNAVMIYDYRDTSHELKTIAPKPNSSTEVIATTWDRSDSVLFVVGGETSNGFITPYHGETFQPLSDPMITHCGRITDIDFDRNNERFATVSEDSLLQIHCLPEIICERVFSNKNDVAFKRVSFSCDSQYVAVSSQGNCIQIYNVQKGGQAYKLKCSQSQQMLGWHPRKMVLAYLDEEDKKRSLGREEDPYVHLFYQ